ncbi:hypothetical protein INR49_029694, partial [Caranx melampygus]
GRCQRREQRDAGCICFFDTYYYDLVLKRVVLSSAAIGSGCEGGWWGCEGGGPMSAKSRCHDHVPGEGVGIQDTQ